MKSYGGLDMNAERFTDDVRAVVLDLLPHARLVVKLPPEAVAGARFNNNETVLWRIESMFTEDEFIHEPLQVLEAALIDAAKADHWYEKEKDYGLEDDCCYGQCADDYESESDAC